MGSRERIERERAELKQKREQEIIDAAEILFLEKGFHKTTVGDIVRACDLTNGALYLYFKSKEELFLAVMTRINRSFADFLEKKVDPVFAGFDQLAAYVDFYRDSFTSFHRYHVLDAQFNGVFTTAYPDSPRREEYFSANNRIYAALKNAFETGLADRTIKLPLTGKNALDRTVHMILNVLNSYMEKLSLRREIMEREQRISLEEELRDYTGFLLESCRAPYVPYS